MNREIELIKSEIYEANANLEKFTKLLKNEPENINYSFYVTYFTNRLNILQQIKTILEAWEVISNPHNIIQFCDGILEIWYNPQKEENTLKKALEVEDEKSI